MSSGARDAFFDNAGGRSYQGDVLSLPLPYVRCLLGLLPHVLEKALSRPRGSCVPGGRVSPHVSMGRVTCPLLLAAAHGAA